MENQTFKDIQNGKYKEAYLIYCRRSTDDADNQKNSLSYQYDENIRFAKKEKFNIAKVTLEGIFTEGVIREKHSSFKEDELMVFNNDGAVTFNIERPKFYKMVEFLNKKLFKGVVFMSWDRASRNPTDDNIIKKLMNAGVDIKFSMAEYSKTSSGALHMDIDGMFAQHHSRVTSEKVRLTFKKSKNAGLRTNKAPVGYLNEGNMEWKPVDPVRAPIIKRMFELADEGWSLIDICKWSIEQGFTMPLTRKKRTKDEILKDEDDDEQTKVIERYNHLPKYTTIQKILRNNYYIGLVKDNDGNLIISTSHEPLVGRELFERVQDKLLKKNKSKKYDKPLEYPFRKVFQCEGCKRSYTPYPKKGNLYVVSKCDANCINRQKSFRLEKLLDERVKPIVTKLYFTDKQIGDFEKLLSKEIGTVERKRITVIEEKEKRKKTLREKLLYLRENKLDLLKAGAYSFENISTEENKLEVEIANIIIDEGISEEAMRATMKDVATISELLKNVAIHWDYADLYEKEEITRSLFSELFIFDNTFNYKLNLGFKAFDRTFQEPCAVSAWLSELYPHREAMQKVISNYGYLVKAF